MSNVAGRESCLRFLAMLLLLLSAAACSAPARSEEAATSRTRQAVHGIVATWQPEGPGPIRFGQVENITPDNGVIGAVHALVPHPADPDLLYAGAVNGGMWRTENATSLNPTWTPLTDQFGSLSISALAMDPTNSNVLLAGTGNYSSFGESGAFIGLLLSTDGGDTWTNIADPLLVQNHVSGLAIRGNVVLAGTFFNGLVRSTNGGATWAVISGAPGSGLPFGSIIDLVSDPTNGNRYYVTVPGGLFRSNDSGATWVNVGQNHPGLQQALVGGFSNAEMAVGNTGRLYVRVIINPADFVGFTNNQGASWTAMDPPLLPQTLPLTNIIDASNTAPIVITTADPHNLPVNGLVLINISGVLGNTAANGNWLVFINPADPPNQFTLPANGNGAYAGGGTWLRFMGLNPIEEEETPGGQGFLHSSIVVDPVDPNTVYLGGDRQDFPNIIGAFDFSGNLVRGDASVAPTGAVPSPQWEHLTHSNAVPEIPGGGTPNSSAPHADSRDMVFDANGELIECSDGGIYRRSSPEDNTGVWTFIGGNMSVTEFHDIAYDPLSQVIFGGTQDVGTPSQSAPGSPVFDSLLTADGGDVQVDAISIPGQSIRYISFQVLIGFQRRFFDAANNLLAVEGVGLNPGGGDPLSPQFYTPIELNKVNPTRIVIAGANFLYESFDRGDNITSLGTAGFSPSMAYGHPLNADALWVAGQVFVRTVGGAPLLLTPTPFPPGFAEDVVMDPADFNHAYLISFNTVWETPDAGLTWIDITGDLSPEPTERFQEIIYVPGGAVDKIMIATNLGVFATSKNSLGFWNEVGNNLPNANVKDLDYDPVRDFLVAGLLGRGAWSLSNAADINLPPVARCQDTTSCDGNVSPADVDAGSFDPEGGAVTLSLAPPGPFPFGTTQVTLTVTDPVGASETCTAVVTVSDADELAFTFVPPDITTTACGSIDIGMATATGSCSGGAVTITNNAPAQFPPGTTLVTWTATDSSGNSITATQRVTVILTDNPACCPAGTNIIVGTSNNNTLNGTAGPDCILGLGAQDTINGLGGNDFISGGDGNDNINAGSGNDVVFGGSAQDILVGGTGADSMDGGDGDDTVRGGDGNDTLRGGQGQDQVFGENNNDTLFGDSGDDRLDGGAGNDNLVGGENNDRCIGGTGTNTFAQCEFGAPNSCVSGTQNGTETDIDCGGACPTCGAGDSCISGNDCQGGICAGLMCQAPP
jgi:RTX calcium-binding nonapeptide repeat (4 copies)